MYIHKKTFIFSLFFTAVTTLIVGTKLLQHHPYLKTFAAKKICQQMEKSFNCTFIADVESINFFTWTISCKNVRVKPKESEKQYSWYWFAQRLKFSFSPIELLLTNKIMLCLDIQNAHAYSTVSDKEFTLGTHLKELFFGQSFKVPIVLKTLKMHNTKLDLHNEQYDVNGTICWSGTSKKIGDKLKCMFYLSNGTIECNGKKAADTITGTMYANVARCGSHTVLLDLRTQLMENKQPCFIEGQLHDKKGSVRLWSQNKHLLFDLKIEDDNITTDGTFDSSFFRQLFPQLFFDEQIHVTAKTSLNNNLFDSEITTKTLPIKSTWSYNKKNLSFNFTNIEALVAPIFSSWIIEKDTIVGTGSYKNNEKNLSILIPLQNKLSNKTCLLRGNFSSTENIFQATGLFGFYEWKASGTLFPNFTIDTCHVENANNQPLATFDCAQKNELNFHNTLYYQEIKNVLPDILRTYLDGNAIFEIDGILSRKNLTLHIKLIDGTIAFGPIHNMLTHLDGTVVVDFLKKTVTLSSSHLQFNEGQAEISKAMIYFDTYLRPYFVHIPLTFQKCLINLGKNFLSGTGNLTLICENQHNHISGNILLEKSFLYELPNFNANTALFAKPISCSLHIETKDGMRIYTPGLQTQLHADVKASYDKTSFRLDGWAKLPHGNIILPYSRLNIISGALYFTSEQQFDPLLELTAKTQLNHHTITVHATGSLKNPIIRLSSIPTLTEEKIASLILTGSPKVSLNAIAPSLIIEFIKKQIIEQNSPFMQRKNLKSLLKPLKYIKFTPSFSDETGFNGLCGGVELDLGKRLHAKVQKNLNLQEDTEFEINYHISDELNVQAFKNDHGDIGGQIQMNLKL